MNPSSQSQLSKHSFTEQEIEQVKAFRAKVEGEKPKPVDPVWQFVAEFGYYYGWGGAWAILNNEIDLDTANAMMDGARTVWSEKVIDHALASRAGFASANTTTSGEASTEALKDSIRKHFDRVEAQQDAQSNPII